MNNLNMGQEKEVNLDSLVIVKCLSKSTMNNLNNGCEKVFVIQINLVFVVTCLR